MLTFASKARPGSNRQSTILVRGPHPMISSELQLCMYHSLSSSLSGRLQPPYITMYITS